MQGFTPQNERIYRHRFYGKHKIKEFSRWSKKKKTPKLLFPSGAADILNVIETAAAIH